MIPSDTAVSSPSIAGNCTLLPLIAPVQRSTLKVDSNEKLGGSGGGK
jgi:hypothetical protein